MAVALRVPASVSRSVLLDTVETTVADAQTSRNVQHLISRLGDAQLVDLVNRTLSHDVTPAEFADALSRAQRDHVRAGLVAGRRTVALYFPTATYREHIAGLARRLREQGFNVVIALGIVCGDRFERDPQAHFAGRLGALTLLEAWDFVDLVVAPVLATELPPHARRVYVLHDIHDSPLGDERTVKEIADNLRAYDYVYAPSPSAVDVFRRVIPQRSPARDARTTRIVPGGYMKLDRFVEDFARHRTDARSIVYAPTVTGYGLDSVGTVAACGRDIIATLLDAADDHEIIFRPHPHSLRTEPVARIVEEFRAHPRFTLDDNASSYAGTYGRARLMVSDISGTAFTYALATLRPVVFCSFNEDELEARYGSLRYVRDRERVGYIVHNTAQLAATIRGFVTGDIPAPRDIARYRNEALFNVGGAHEYFVRHCGDFMAGTTAADWIEAIS